MKPDWLWPWHLVQRRIDLLFLWPACRYEAWKQCKTVDHAKAAFAYHCFNDPAWLVLGRDEIKRRIDRLR